MRARLEIDENAFCMFSCCPICTVLHINKVGKRYLKWGDASVYSKSYCTYRNHPDGSP